MGAGGSFTAVQGEGVHDSCISRSSSVTLTVCCQFYKAELVSSFLETCEQACFEKFVNEVLDFIAIKYYIISKYHIFKKMMEI